MRTLPRVAGILFFFLAAARLAADPIRTSVSNFTAAASSPSIDLIANGADYHKIAFYPVGAPASCSVKLEKSADGASWSDLIAGTACTASGITAATNGLVAYVRITVTALSAAAQVRVLYMGFRGNPDAAGGATANQGTPAAVASAWPMLITDGVDTAGVSAGGYLQVTCDNCGAATNYALEAGGNLATLAGKDFATQTTLALIKAKTDNIPALGQALAAASWPVVLTAAQLSTLTPPAAISGFATSAKQDTGNASVASIDGKTPALGQALATASVPVVMTAAQLTTLTPVTTITATQGTGSNLHVAVDSAPTTAVTSAGLTNLDVALSTRTKPADQQHAIVDSGTITTVSTVTAVTAITNALPAGSNVIGHTINDTGSTTAVTGNVTVVQPTASSLKAQVAQLASISSSATLQSAATANGNGTVLTVDGMSTAVLTVNCSSCSGGTLINFEASEDSSNFTAQNAVQVGSSTIASTTTTSGVTVWEMPVGGMVQLRARISAYSAGTITVTGHAVPVSYNPKVINANIASLPSGAVTQATAANLNAAVVGTGTAGSPAGNILTIQGVASMTKLLVTPDSVALPANQSTNIAQWNGAAPSQTNPVAVVFPGTLVSGAVTSAMASTTSTSVVGGTGSNYLYITQCTTSNASLTVSTDIILQDGSAGTTLYVLPAPAAAIATTGGAGGAFTFPVPLKVPTSGNGLFAANVTTGSSTKISCSGFRSTVSY